ncbi:tripartite ATP-independent transporter DctP family solute receptor [Haloactinopolyspora alba]|uniref:Tripartite ATP-independent transporter DctP family solute receptor n=1 Tax=Haloactinopolyspora alba TaxID=648780 RepID=A0A2P8EF31_9ACTN|nr:DctP family TRAP transporter solute-binding subunit [Haloactinopolyspora alba]PSL08061.1 tripartite ATP-independent transporter DctP family solute receptor [Haloactinopolyspora alba]
MSRRTMSTAFPVAAVMAASALVLSSCGDDASAGGGSGTGLKLGIPDPAESAVGVAAQDFADQVEEATGGDVTVEVFPDGTLFGGDQNAAVNQLKNGSIDALMLSTSVFASFDDRFNAISMPYLFKDEEQYASYLSGEPGQQLLAGLEDIGVTGLAMIPRTFRHTTTSGAPIESPADFEGVKLRVPNNDLWVKFFESLGAQPTPMDFSEVYTALQLGAIDGQENPAEVPVANKFYEVQQHISLTGHIADAFVLALNSQKWESLDADTQETVRGVAQDVAAQQVEQAAANEQKLLDQLKSEGMKVTELSEQQRAAFAAEAEKLYPEFESLVGGPEFFRTTLEFTGHDLP